MAGGFRLPGSGIASPSFLLKAHQTSKELHHTGTRNPAFFSTLGLLDNFHEKGGLLTLIVMMLLI